MIKNHNDLLIGKSEYTHGNANEKLHREMGIRLLRGGEANPFVRNISGGTDESGYSGYLGINSTNFQSNNFKSKNQVNT